MATSKLLVDQAMRMQHPDQIPVMCQMANGHTIINTGVHPIDYFTSDDVWADCLIKMRELYDFDGILCHKPSRTPRLMELVERVERDGEIPTLFLRDGSRIECTRDDDAYYKKNDDFRFPTLDEIDFDRPLSLVGMEDGLMALLTEPEKTKRLMETCTKWSVALAVAQVRRGAHAIKVSSPFAGSGFLSPDMYEEFIIPAESKIAEAVKKEGAFSYTHTCGAIGDRLELMMKAGVSGIECLDPPPLGNVDLADAVERCNGKIFIKGNMDPVNTLLRGDAEKVNRDVTQILETAGRSLGGFILSSACSVAPPTPPDNIKRAVELCRKFKP